MGQSAISLELSQTHVQTKQFFLLESLSTLVTWAGSQSGLRRPKAGGQSVVDWRQQGQARQLPVASVVASWTLATVGVFTPQKLADGILQGSPCASRVLRIVSRLHWLTQATHSDFTFNK